MTDEINEVESGENLSVNLIAHVPITPSFPVVDSYRLTRKLSHGDELPDGIVDGLWWLLPFQEDILQ